MRIFKTSWFDRFARKNKIEDDMLSEAVTRFRRGLIDVDLGNGVFKQRLARLGEGRSKGFRTILLVKRDEAVFFVYGFAKSTQENIKKNEEEAFKELATHMFSLTENQLASLIKTKDLVEVTNG